MGVFFVAGYVPALFHVCGRGGRGGEGRGGEGRGGEGRGGEGRGGEGRGGEGRGGEGRGGEGRGGEGRGWRRGEGRGGEGRRGARREGREGGREEGRGGGGGGELIGRMLLNWTATTGSVFALEYSITSCGLKIIIDKRSEPCTNYENIYVLFPHNYAWDPCVEISHGAGADPQRARLGS